MLRSKEHFEDLLTVVDMLSAKKEGKGQSLPKMKSLCLSTLLPPPPPLGEIGVDEICPECLKSLAVFGDIPIGHFVLVGDSASGLAD